MPFPNEAEVLKAAHETTWAIVPERLKALLATIEPRAGASELVPQLALTGSKDNIAVIPLYGTITQRASFFSMFFGGTSTDVFGYVFDAAIKDSGIDAIVIDIDSPGGTVFGVPELAQKIFGARGKKPIYAISNSFAGSAAYWIGSAADKLYVTPSGEVGSIGVFVLHIDWSEALKQDGIKPTFIQGGKYKTEGNPFEPLDDEARENIQKEVDVYYDMFLGDVARNREVGKSVVRKEFGEGRMVNAKEAVKRDMADKVSTFEELLNGLDAKFSKRRKAIQRQTQQNARELAKRR